MSLGYDVNSPNQSYGYRGGAGGVSGSYGGSYNSPSQQSSFHPSTSFGNRMHNTQSPLPSMYQRHQASNQYGVPDPYLSGGRGEAGAHSSYQQPGHSMYGGVYGGRAGGQIGGAYRNHNSYDHGYDGSEYDDQGYGYDQYQPQTQYQRLSPAYGGGQNGMGGQLPYGYGSYGGYAGYQNMPYTRFTGQGQGGANSYQQQLQQYYQQYYAQQGGCGGGCGGYAGGHGDCGCGGGCGGCGSYAGYSTQGGDCGCGCGGHGNCGEDTSAKIVSRLTPNYPNRKRHSYVTSGYGDQYKQKVLLDPVSDSAPFQSQRRITYQPFTRKYIDYQEHINFIPVQRAQWQYQKIMKQIDFVPKEYWESHIDYVPREKIQQKIRYIPTQQQIVHVPQQELIRTDQIQVERRRRQDQAQRRQHEFELQRQRIEQQNRQSRQQAQQQQQSQHMPPIRHVQSSVRQIFQQPSQTNLNLSSRQNLPNAREPIPVNAHVHGLSFPSPLTGHNESGNYNNYQQQLGNRTTSQQYDNNVPYGEGAAFQSFGPAGVPGDGSASHHNRGGLQGSYNSDNMQSSGGYQNSLQRTQQNRNANNRSDNNSSSSPSPRQRNNNNNNSDNNLNSSRGNIQSEYTDGDRDRDRGSTQRT